MDITFKKVTLDKADLLLKIAKNAFINTYEHLNDPVQFEKYLKANFTLSQTRSSLEIPQSHYYFGYHKGQIVSYFHTLEYPHQTDINTRNSLEISRFYVLKEYKRMGFGAKMMAFLKSLAQELYKKEIWLGVWEKNDKAITFYEKMGFKITGNHSFMIGNEEQTDHIMRYKI